MKTIQKFSYLTILLLFALISCQDTPEVINTKVCEGYNRHNHSESVTREYAPVAGTSCLASSDCENIKQLLIAKAQGLATAYCRNFRCQDNDRESCKGRFILQGSTCSISSKVNADGITICTETVTINGVIDCFCE